MQEIKTVKANIDYPQEEETITSPHYTFRIKAPLNAEKVEVRIDGAPWKLCRYSSGFWWYDWTDYGTGEHEVVARILPFDNRNFTLRTRRFSVELNDQPSLTELAQYSIMTSSEPWMLAKLTQVLANRREGLREQLEAVGLKVTEIRPS